MSQPTLTVQIQQLESAVGVKLFDRNKRHHRPRPGRSRFAGAARAHPHRSRGNRDQHRRVARASARSRDGGLAAVDGGRTAAAGHQKKLSVSYPGIRVRVHYCVAGTVAAMVRRGRCRFRHQQSDLRRSRADEPCAADGPTLRGRVAVACTRPRKQSISVRELAKHPLVLMGKDSSSRQIVDLAFIPRRARWRMSWYEATYGIVRWAGWRRPGWVMESSRNPWSAELPAPGATRGGALTRRIGIVMRAGALPVSDGLKTEARFSSLWPKTPRIGSAVASGRRGGCMTMGTLSRLLFVLVVLVALPACELVGASSRRVSVSGSSWRSSSWD